MEAAAAYSHRSDKVSSGVPLAPTSWHAAQEAPRSRHAVLVCYCHHVRSRVPVPMPWMRCMEEEAQQRQQELLAM
jgi:hypothetical protein